MTLNTSTWEFYRDRHTGRIIRREVGTGQLWGWEDDTLGVWSKLGSWASRAHVLGWEEASDPEGPWIALIEEGEGTP